MRAQETDCVVIVIDRLIDGRSNYESWTFTLKIGAKSSAIDIITRYGSHGSHKSTVRTPGTGGWA